MALALALPAVAPARTLDEIIKSRTLRVGVNPNFPPMSSYGKTNDLEGFDIDIGNKVAEALGVKVEFVPTESGAARAVPGRRPHRHLARRPDAHAERAKLVIDYTVPLHTEAMAVLTTDKVAAQVLEGLEQRQSSRSSTCAATLGRLSSRRSCRTPKVLLVDTNADTVRAIAQGRADALVENIDFFLDFTKNYPDVKWRVLTDPIFVAYCGIGVRKGNDGAAEFLNILLYDLHSSNYVNETWEKWYGAPMRQGRTGRSSEPHCF